MAELEKKPDLAEDLKKALALFTFKGQMDRYKPQRGSRLPLAPMLASLRGMSPRQWAAYAFGRDPLRGKFTPEQMLELSDKALACGQEEARKLLDAHHGKVEPTLLARELGLTIERPDMPNGGGQVIFAQYEEPDKITVFMDTVDKANALLGSRPDLVNLLGKRSIEQVLVAHEIFHAVELRAKDTIFTQSYRLQLWKLGPIKNESGVACLAEIAGMEFARTLLDLDFCPYLYDVFFVSLYDAQAASDLYRSICRLCSQPSIEETMAPQELREALEAEDA